MCLVALAGLGATASAAHAVDITPAISADASTSMLMQTGRISRDGVTSTCAAPHAAPSVIDDMSSFRFRNHTFISRLTNPICFQVIIDSSCLEIFSVAYLGTFDPANPRTRYVADMGDTPGWPDYSFTVPPGSPVGVVFHQVVTSPTCGDYTVTFRTVGPWADAAPSIAGTPAVGSVLTGTNATWKGTPSVQRRWLRCDAAGANCGTIPGAAGATYTVEPADLGGTIRFRNDATDADGTSGSQSLLVEPFIPFDSRASQSLAAGDRSQSGIFVRNALESRCGAPTSAPAVLQAGSLFLYDSFPVTSLLNEPVCLVARTQPGLFLSCPGGVSPSIYNPAFAPALGLAANYAANSGVAFTSAAAVSSTMPAASPREVTVYHGSSTGTCDSYSVTLGADAPFATARPALTGTAATGSALSASNGTWSGGPAFAVTWRRCDAAGNACAAIAGATGASYAPTNADVGKTLRARVTATRGRSVSSDSPPSAVVLDRTGPVGSLRLGSRNLRKAVRSGRVPVRVRCDEACTAVLELRITRKLSRKLKLKRKIVIARGKGKLRAGRRKTLRVKLTKPARRALRTQKSVKFRIRGTFKDGLGNRSRKAPPASLKLPKKKSR
jgi:hypothetical protein